VALALAEMFPDPQRALNNLGWVELTETEMDPGWGSVTFDAEIEIDFCEPAATAAV
jgi:hypothetical protein